MQQEERTRQQAFINRRSAIRMSGIAIAASLATTHAIGSGTTEGQATTEAKQPIATLQTEFVYESLVTIEPAVQVGPSSHGTRRYIPITGGTFAGPRIKGTVLPGGADWQLERPDGVTEVDATYSVKADDGAVIIVHNRGIIAGPYFRTVPQFEATHRSPTTGSTNRSLSGQSLDPCGPGAVIVRVFRVL